MCIGGEGRGIIVSISNTVTPSEYQSFFDRNQQPLIDRESAKVNPATHWIQSQLITFLYSMPVGGGVPF